MTPVEGQTRTGKPSGEVELRRSTQPKPEGKSMKVGEAMHRGVEWRSPETPVSEIAKVMRDEDVGAVPIGENDRLVGMVTDRDIVCRGCAAGGATDQIKARDVMTSGIVYCVENEEVSDAVHLMEDKKIRRLPVLNAEKRMIGMLSLGDVADAAPQTLVGELCQSVAAHH
jgi:CBS domain-containing protein